MKKDKICTECGRSFHPSSPRRKFCSLECCWAWRKGRNGPGQFQPGMMPWNAGTVGKTARNRTSFQPGHVSKTKCAIGDVCIRLRTREGTRRAWTKVAENGDSYDWKLRAVVVWEAENGPLEKGWIVHHRDHDALNDSLDNLVAVSRGDHLRLHRSFFEARRKSAASKAAKARHHRNRAAKASN